MKKGAVFFLMLLIVPFVLADIDATTDQNVYNIGNKIKTSASIIYDSDFEGLFKLAILCGTYRLDYFVAPVSLEANFRTAVNVPELMATSSMLGNCTVIGSLATNDNLVIEEKSSDSFEVTRHLSTLPVNAKITSLPESSILLSGIVNEAFGNNILKAATRITLDNNSYSGEAIDGKFNITIDLPTDIKSGKHMISIAAFDSKNNYGESSVELSIIPIPSSIELQLENNQLLPGSKLWISASLYDQANDLINTSLNLELISPGKNNVFTKVVQSNDRLEYEFSQYAEPGIYIMKSTYQNLLAQAPINITIVREVKVKYQNEIVSVENIGNVPFEDELTFILESDSKKYPITKKVNVEPSKLLEIDLSKEVPLGVYDIKMPLKDGIGPVKNQVEEVLQGIVESTKENFDKALPSSAEASESLLADNVEIHDNRPAYKKVASGVSSISGAIVGSDGMLAKNPLLAPIILVIIVLILVFRYGRKPILALIKRDKKDRKDEN